MLGDFQAKGIAFLDLHELAAGKLAALMARGQVRDLFDCQRLLSIDGIQCELLRIAFVVYGGMNRKDWRTVSIDDVDFDTSELTRLLIPTLDMQFIQKQGSPSTYGKWLVDECREGLRAVLPFSDAEKEFLDLLLDQGEINAKLLTPDANLQERIQNQPLLQWKALNVRRHRGLP